MPKKKKPKEEQLRARVTADVKRRISYIALERGEAESLILREAIDLYLAHSEKEKAPPNKR